MKTAQFITSHSAIPRYIYDKKSIFFCSADTQSAPGTTHFSTGLTNPLNELWPPIASLTWVDGSAYVEDPAMGFTLQRNTPQYCLKYQRTPPNDILATKHCYIDETFMCQFDCNGPTGKEETFNASIVYILS